MASKLLRVLAPVLVIAGGIGIYQVLHATKPEPQKDTTEPRPISVRVATVSAEPVTLTVKSQGDVRARTEMDLVAQVGGRITWVSPEFTEGGAFEPDAALLRIEDTDYQLALHQARARVAAAQVGVEQALADQDVARKQLRNDPTATPLALKKPQVTEARAQLAAAEAELEQTQVNLARTEVSLPFQGRVISKLADTGQYVSPGTRLGRAFATDTVEIRLPLTDRQLAALGLPIGYAAPAGQGVPSIVSADVAGQEHQWQGRLIRLDASIDPETRLLYGIVEVESPYNENRSALDMPLAVGLFADVSIDGRAMDTATVIPPDGLRAGDVVYLLNDNNRLEMRQIDVAHRSSERVVVSQGLSAGERVVTSAIRNPISGMALAAIASDEPGVAAN